MTTTTPFDPQTPTAADPGLVWAIHAPELDKFPWQLARTDNRVVLLAADGGRSVVLAGGSELPAPDHPNVVPFPLIPPRVLAAAAAALRAAAAEDIHAVLQSRRQIGSSGPWRTWSPSGRTATRRGRFSSRWTAPGAPTPPSPGSGWRRPPRTCSARPRTRPPPTADNSRGTPTGAAAGRIGSKSRPSLGGERLFCYCPVTAGAAAGPGAGWSAAHTGANPFGISP